MTSRPPGGRWRSSRGRLTAVLTLALWVIGGLAAAMVSPPDPYSQLLAFLPVLVLSPPVAYWLAGRWQAPPVAEP